MLNLLAAGGWVMPLIVLCSVLALAISIERSVALNPARITPAPACQCLEAAEGG